MRCSYDRSCLLPVDYESGICAYHAVVFESPQYFKTRSLGANDASHDIPVVRVGARPQSRKLLEAQIIEIVRRRRAGTTLKVLAADFKVSQKLIATTQKRYAAEASA